MKRLITYILFCLFIMCGYAYDTNNMYPEFRSTSAMKTHYQIHDIAINQQYPHTYNQDFHRTISYNQGSYSTAYSSAPMKAPGKHESGSATVTSADGQIITVTWKADSDGNGQTNWIITYSYPDGTIEYDSYYGAFGGVKTYAQNKAEEKAKEYANNSYSSSIGSSYVILLYVMLYAIHRRNKYKNLLCK